MPMNETAFDYVAEECDYTVLKDGSVLLYSDVIGDFISDAELSISCNHI